MIKARFIEAVRAQIAAGHMEREGCAVNAMIVLVLLAMAVTVVLIPLAWRFYRQWRQRERLGAALHEVLDFARRAEAVMAFPLMVNRVLRTPGDQESAGLVLVCFDPVHGNSMPFMADMAVTVGRGGELDDDLHEDGDGHDDGDDEHERSAERSASRAQVEGDAASVIKELSPEDRAFCVALMNDEQYVPYRRRRVPDSITGGVAVWACDLWIDPGVLHGRRVSDEMPLLPCMAEPGPAGRITQIPWWVQLGVPAPDEDAEASFIRSMAMMSVIQQAARQQAGE